MFNTVMNNGGASAEQLKPATQKSKGLSSHYASNPKHVKPDSAKITKSSHQRTVASHFATQDNR